MRPSLRHAAETLQDVGLWNQSRRAFSPRCLLFGRDLAKRFIPRIANVHQGWPFVKPRYPHTHIVPPPIWSVRVGRFELPRTLVHRVLNLGLPVTPGVSRCRIVRKHKAIQCIPAVVVSSHTALCQPFRCRMGAESPPISAVMCGLRVGDLTSSPMRMDQFVDSSNSDPP